MVNSIGFVKICVFSRLTYRKGVDFLYFLVPVIYKKYPNVKFYIYGDGNKQPLLNDLKNEFKMNDRVQIVKGFAKWENVPSILAEHDIILSSSLTESFCLLILEAIASGLYVISTGIFFIF